MTDDLTAGVQIYLQMVPDLRVVCHIERGITQVTPSNAMLTGQIPVGRALPELPLQLTCYLQLFVCLASAGLALESCLPSLHHHSDCASCLLDKKTPKNRAGSSRAVQCYVLLCSKPLVKEYLL